MTANAEYWRDKALAAEARVAELEEMVGVLGRVADSAAESLASATGSAALDPNEHSLIKIALLGGDGLETGLAASAIRMSNRVAELETKLAGCQDHTERQAAMCFEQARQIEEARELIEASQLHNDDCDCRGAYRNNKWVRTTLPCASCRARTFLAAQPAKEDK